MKIFKRVLDFYRVCDILYYDAVYSTGKGNLALRVSKIQENKNGLGTAFIWKRMNRITIKDLYDANKP